MKWRDCLENGIVRKRSKDAELAKALLAAAKDRIEEYAEKQEMTDKNARFVFEEYYEAILELIHSLLAASGYRAGNHECAIEFLRFYPELGEAEIELLHRMRRIRNSIKYYGSLMHRDEIEALISRAKILFNKIMKLQGR